MYLKINDGNKDYFYKFDKPEVTIGRGSTNDISVHADGVSRVHLKVVVENGGEFYVIDQGATNGTFINEQKLAPQKKIPFNTFFPVQLGFYAKLHLLDESNVETLEKLIKITKQELADQEE